MLTTEFSLRVSADVGMSEIMQGVFEIDGLLSYADEVITLEVQTKGLAAAERSVTSVEVPLDALQEVRMKRKAFGSKIILRPKRLATLESAPGIRHGELVLKVKRSDRKQAAELVSHLQRILSYKSAENGVGSVPFRLPDTGLREISGVLYLDDEFLIFDVADALVGHFDRKQQVIKVATRALDAIRLDERRFRDRLYVRPRKRDLLDAMPGIHKNEIVLKIRRKFRNETERLIYEVTRLRRMHRSRHDAEAADERREAADERPEAANDRREATDERRVVEDEPREAAGDERTTSE